MKPIDKSLLLFGDGIMSSNMEKENVTENRKQIIARLAYDFPVLRARLGISQEEMSAKIDVAADLQCDRKRQERYVMDDISCACCGIPKQ